MIAWMVHFEHNGICQIRNRYDVAHGSADVDIETEGALSPGKKSLEEGLEMKFACATDALMEPPRLKSRR